MDADDIDFALVVWREDGQWHVERLAPKVADHLDTLVHALRQQPGEGGSMAMVSVGEEFFLIVRVGPDGTRLLLSDALAALDWELAQDALGHLGEEMPEDEDDEAALPVGDLDIVADLGMDGDELELLCLDVELFPDEALASIAARGGFAEQYDSLTADA